MIQQRLQQWILHPECLNEDTLFELRELLQRFPYFQTARLLYLKNLFLLKDANFKEELRKSVLYVADLSLLFYYIEGDFFTIEKHPSQDNSRANLQGTDRTLLLIDRFLADNSEECEETHTLSVQPEVCVDYASALLRTKSEQEERTCHSIPLKGQELIDNFIESADISATSLPVGDEFPIMAGKGEFSKEESGVGAAENLTHEKDILSHSLVEGSEEQDPGEDESYFTETLAKIYVKQQRYDKALEIIKKLNLKYPKKNAYFADQIRFLEKLIINAKSK